jgi:hypothetical protein
MTNGNKWQIAFFILGIITLIIAIWAGIYTYKSYNLSKENQELKTQVNVASYNQQGGITAGELTLGQIPRHLTDEIAKELELKLKQIDARGVIITSVGLSQGEPYSYAFEIKEFLEKNGWIVDGVNQAVYSVPINGQFIEPELDSNGFAQIIIGNAL